MCGDAYLLRRETTLRCASCACPNFQLDARRRLPAHTTTSALHARGGRHLLTRHEHFQLAPWARVCTRRAALHAVPAADITAIYAVAGLIAGASERLRTAQRYLHPHAPMLKKWGESAVYCSSCVGANFTARQPTVGCPRTQNLIPRHASYTDGAGAIF